MIYNLYDNMISQIDILSKFKNIYLNMSLTQSVYNFTIPLCISKYFYIRLSKLLKCFATLLCVGICMTIAIYLTFKMNCGMMIKTRVLQITMIICCICSKKMVLLFLSKLQQWCLKIHD